MNLPGDRGQATVELALLLPLVVLLLVALIQGGLIVRSQILLTHAAREAVRAASLDADLAAIESAANRAGPLDPDRLEVHVTGRAGPGSLVTVRAVYTTPVGVPGVGLFTGAVTLEASASMRVER